MNRRTFLKQSGKLSALSFLPLSSIASSQQRFKLGLQLYTVRDAMEKNPVQGLKSLKAMGYEDFETYGYNTESKTYYGYSPQEFKDILGDLGLSSSSGHYGVNNLMESSDDEVNRYVDSCIEGATILGDKYIVYPSLREAYRNASGYANLVRRLNKMGERIHKAGLGFAYHNFGYDFDLYDDRSGMDWVIQETDPDWVKLQVDFYWVMHASKISPKALINKAPGRFKLWHIKDMHKVSRDYTELGNGSIDYTKILPDAKHSGLEYYYIEQGGNFAVNSMESVEESARFLKKKIQHLI